MNELSSRTAFYEQTSVLEHKPGTVQILQGLLTDAGLNCHIAKPWSLRKAIFTDNKKKKLRQKTPKGQEITYFTDLSIGDYVVHSVHGIGKYVGLTIETEGIHKDYIEIAYAGTDRLFLPAGNLDQLQKYIGNEGGCTAHP